MPRSLRVLLSTLSVAAPALAQAPAPAAPTPPRLSEYVEVTATRVPRDTLDVPASITVLSAQDLRDIGATDLPSALRFAAGVDMVPGGDAGPAASVPEIWGLREFDSVLLVVDGVPRSGAFTPSFESIDLADIERIEVLRGAAPVTFGATSFNGVIHIIRREGSLPHGQATGFGGSYGTFGGGLSASLPRWGGLHSSVAIDGERRGYRDPRTSFGRGHLLWQGSVAAGEGRLAFDVDGVWLDQHPASPHPRGGPGLSPRVPLDTNHNPTGAFADGRWLQVGTSFERPAANATWSSRLAFTGSRRHDLRGFLRETADVPGNATGYRRDLDESEIYFDSHLAWTGRVDLLAGADFTHGEGKARGGAFDYTVSLDGSGAPDGSTLAPEDTARIESRRDLAGAYGLVSVQAFSSLRIEGGVRLNVVAERRDEDAHAEAEPAGEEERTDVRPSGSLGAVFTAWSSGRDTLRLYANVRSTFKPAVFDFGIGEGEEGSESALLEPESAKSGDVGVKARLAGGRLDAELSAFLMDFENLVVSNSRSGLPVLENAGQARFKGVEAQATFRIVHGLSVRGACSWHDAVFRDYVRDFDGVPTQLAGNRLEMSPDWIASAGVSWAGERGPMASFSARYVGERYLNKRNTAVAPGYTTLDAGAGWRFARYEVHVDARNLTNERPPVAESEIGDAQYYLLPAREIRVSARVRF